MLAVAAYAIRLFSNLFIYFLFVCLLIIDWLIFLFIYSFIMYSFIQSFIYSFIHSFIFSLYSLYFSFFTLFHFTFHLFIYLFICLFIYLFHLWTTEQFSAHWFCYPTMISATNTASKVSSQDAIKTSRNELVMKSNKMSLLWNGW